MTRIEKAPPALSDLYRRIPKIKSRKEVREKKHYKIMHADWKPAPMDSGR